MALSFTVVPYIEEVPKMIFTSLYWTRTLPDRLSCGGCSLWTLVSKGYLGFEDELLGISLINLILKVSSKGLTFDGGMTHIVMEGAVILGLESLWVL